MGSRPSRRRRKALTGQNGGDASVPSPHNPSPAPTGTKGLPRRHDKIPTIESPSPVPTKQVYLLTRRECSMKERTLLPVLPDSVQSTVSQVMEVGSRVQPFSNESREKAPRTRDAKVVHSVCPYCAVGCSLNVYVKDGEVIDIEGD